MDLPIACTLTEDELRERRRTVFDVLARAALDITSIPCGYVYSFEPSSEVLTELARLVDLERQCCRFLTFKIVLEKGGQPVQLEITGPPDAKPVIEELFHPPRR